MSCLSTEALLIRDIALIVARIILFAYEQNSDASLRFSRQFEYSFPVDLILFFIW